MNPTGRGGEQPLWGVHALRDGTRLTGVAMERTGRLPSAVVAIACLVGGTGCTMCPDPYDYSGPVPNGSAPQNDFHARSNGIIPLGSSPAPWPAVVDATPVQATQVPTIAETKPAGEAAVAEAEDVLEIPAEESVLADDAEVASEPQPTDDESVRMLSAAEDSSTESAPEVAPPAGAVPTESSGPVVEIPTDDTGDVADAAAETTAPRPLVRSASRPAAPPQTTSRSQASRSEARRDPVPQPRLEPDPSAVDLQPVTTAEPPRQPVPTTPQGPTETPGWRPRGYVRPATGR